MFSQRADPATGKMEWICCEDDDDDIKHEIARFYLFFFTLLPGLSVKIHLLAVAMF